MARSGDAHEEIWGTWEDLLLASAVHRHGTSCWDAVTAEVQSRSAASHLLTENSCRDRYEEIQRRFSENGSAVVGSSDEGAGDLDQSESGAWIEELRKLRMAELRREVERYDQSIISLELKVNRLKEEHELSVKESDPSGRDAKQEPTVEDGKHDDEDRSPGSAAAEISSRSCKESNSTDLKQDEEDKKHKSSKSKQDDESGTCAEEDAGTDRTGGETAKRESDESSDVQSSASLSTRRRKAAASSSSEVETEARSEPLVALMEFIRSHPSASLFQRRQPSQESEDYKLMIKRHVDLDTIQSKLDLRNSLESYSSPLEFYRDLLLLFTNTLLFFPKSSPEYSAAFSHLSLTNSHLSSSNLIKPRGISSSSSSSRKEVKIIDILNEKVDMDKKVNPILNEKPTIIMCRKRSSLSKPNNSLQNDTSSIKEERQQIINSGLVSDSDPNLKKVPATRGPRTNKTRTNMTLHSLNPNPSSSISKPQKQQHSNSADKKRTAVDFLNRLNQSAPATSSSRVSMVEKGGKSQSEGKKGNKKNMSPIGKRNVGRPPKRPGSSSVTPPPAKRFKEEKGKKRGGGRR